MKQSHTLMALFICSICFLSLTGCGTKTATNDGVAPVVKTADPNVQVIEITSATMPYDGKAKVNGSGLDSVTTTVSLDKNNVIVSVKNSFVAGYPKSTMFQSSFEKAIATEMVGKNIKDAKITIVAGASMTSAAFNSALDSIRTKVNNG